MSDYELIFYYIPKGMEQYFIKGYVDHSKLIKYTRYNDHIRLCCESCFNKDAKNAGYDFKSSIITYDSGDYECREILGNEIRGKFSGYYDDEGHPIHSGRRDHMYYRINFESAHVDPTITKFIQDNFNIGYDPVNEVLYGKVTDFSISEMSLMLYILCAYPPHSPHMSIEKYKDYLSGYGHGGQNTTNAYAIDLIQRGKHGLVFEDHGGDGVSSNIASMLNEAFIGSNQAQIDDYIDFIKRWGLDVMSASTYSYMGSYGNYLKRKGGTK